jgi:uncharacterized Zn finger protein
MSTMYDFETDCYKCGARQAVVVRYETDADFWVMPVTVRCAKCGALHSVLGDEDEGGSPRPDVQLVEDE